MQQVKASSEINMVGPYLSTQCVCPHCEHLNVLLFIEAYGSPVKVHSVCSHLQAHIMDDDSESVFEFHNGETH